MITRDNSGITRKAEETRPTSLENVREAFELKMYTIEPHKIGLAPLGHHFALSTVVQKHHVAQKLATKLFVNTLW